MLETEKKVKNVKKRILERLQDKSNCKFNVKFLKNSNDPYFKIMTLVASHNCKPITRDLQKFFNDFKDYEK